MLIIIWPQNKFRRISKSWNRNNQKLKGTPNRSSVNDYLPITFAASIIVRPTVDGEMIQGMYTSFILSESKIPEDDIWLKRTPKRCKQNLHIQFSSYFLLFALFEFVLFCLVKFCPPYFGRDGQCKEVISASFPENGGRELLMAWDQFGKEQIACVKYKILCLFWNYAGHDGGRM